MASAEARDRASLRPQCLQASMTRAGLQVSNLEPVNTQKAVAVASNVFMKFLRAEGVQWEYVRVCMARDTAPEGFLGLMDKLGMYLVFESGPKSTNTVKQYFRQVRMWMYDQFTNIETDAVESRLLKMMTTLGKYCMKQEAVGFMNKTPACTKVYLRQTLVDLYSHASSATDYQDAALLSLMWYLFGRASNLTYFRKQNLSISGCDVFFVRFLRMKAAEEQRLSLFPDQDFATCPLLALALALVVQEAPSAALIQLHKLQQKAPELRIEPSTPLVNLLGHPETVNSFDVLEPASSLIKGKSAPGVHSYVNRLLDRIAAPAGVQERLTSHSFWRGGARHTNSESALSMQWITDRGAWNMTTTNKAFAYVFNTPREDHRVSKVLSGYPADKSVALASLASFDEQTKAKIQGVAARLFTSCHNLGTSAYNVNTRVLEVLASYLIRHYLSVKQLNPGGLAVKRLEAAVIVSRSSLAELLAWSAHLAPPIPRLRTPKTS